MFVAYLLLDVLVSNQDRHHENWGIINDDTRTYLAPTFDHAASLGRNECDSVRLKRIASKDAKYRVEAYVVRARSAFYGSPDSTKPHG